jgi:PAS domain S-box-containing protein
MDAQRILRLYYRNALNGEALFVVDGSGGDPAVFSAGLDGDQIREDAVLCRFVMKTGRRLFVENTAREPALSGSHVAGAGGTVKTLSILPIGERRVLCVANGIRPVWETDPEGIADLASLLGDDAGKNDAPGSVWASLFENSAGNMLLVEPETGRVLDANPAARAFFGYDRDTFRRLTVSDLFVDTASNGTHNTDPLVGISTHRHIRTRHRPARGPAKLVEVFATSIKTDGRELLHVTVCDLDEFSRGEDLLRLFETAVDVAVESIIITDAELDEPGPRMIYVNPAFERMTGYRKDEVIGRSPRILQGPQTDPAVIRRLRRALDAGEPFTGEVINYKKDGTPYHVRWSVSPVRDRNGHTTHYVSVQRDITAEQQSARALRESEERWHALVQNHPDAMLISIGGHVVYANPACARLLGLDSPDEMLGHHLLKWIEPAYHADTILRLQAIERGESPPLRDIRLINKQGKVAYVEAKSVLVTYNGRPAVQTVVRDVTEWKITEQQLREREAYYRLLAESISDVIMKHDLNGFCRYVSPSCFGQSGYSPREIANASFRDLVHPDDLDVALEAYQKLLHDGWATITVRVRHRDGHYYWAESTARVIANPTTGKPAEIVTVTRNVNDRVEAMQRLEKSEELVSSIFASSLDGILALEAVRNAKGKIVDFRYLLINPAAEKMIDRPASDLLGERMLEHYPSFRTTGLFDRYARVVETGEPYHDEIEHRGDNLDGWYQVTAVKRGDGIAINFRDISERKQIEEQIYVSLQKERELSELKSRFVAMASHELRTPLSTILSSAELLEQFAHKWTADKIKKPLQRIRNNVNQMTELLDDVLLIGRSESGVITFQPIPVKIPDATNSLLDEICEVVCTRGHVIETHCDESFEAHVDPRLLRMILMNLFSNACKYSTDGSVIHFFVEKAGDLFHMRVQDSGIGISERDLGHIFEPFHRGGNVGAVRGTGLGLSLVSRAVEVHNGRISVDSVEGQGTIVTVTLPLYQAVATTPV